MTTAETAETRAETSAETAGRAATARRALADQLTGRTNRLFYFVVLAVALVGSSTAARGWLFKDVTPAKWHLAAALVAVTVYELGAVAVSRFADQRRQLGERALLARVASAALAGGAITAQWLGHQPDTGPAAFFAGVSATGYVVYLLEAAANRRDALRRARKLTDTPPAYGPAQWLRHPWLTRRARALFLTNAEARLADPGLPQLGRLSSLVAAAEQLRAEKRLTAIGDALGQRIETGVDPTMAKIAVNTYDLGRVAEGIAAGADYPALTRIITAELVPARLVKLVDDADQAAARRPAETPAAPAVPVVPGPAGAVETRETAPVPPAETPAPRPAVEVVPAGAQLLPLVPAVPAAETAETGPVPGASATSTGTGDAGDDKAADQDETDETDDETEDETGPDPLAAIAPKLIPHMVKVIDAHTDWAVSVLMPPRHPDALGTPKIKAAAGITGKQLAMDIRGALMTLATNPETAEQAIRSRSLTSIAAS